MQVNNAARTILLFSSSLIMTGSFGTLVAHALEQDLRKAVLVTPSDLIKSEARTVQMLLEEVQKRTMVRWEVSHAWPAASVPVIAIGPESSLPGFAGPYVSALARGSGNGQASSEGYRIRVRKDGRDAPAVFVIGNDAV